MDKVKNMHKVIDKMRTKSLLTGVYSYNAILTQSHLI